jgi:HK97 family phage portal protein
VTVGLISRLFERRAAPSPVTAVSFPAVNSIGWSDIRRNPTVIACTNVIANAISILPLNLYFKDPATGARQKAGWHPLYQVLRRRPNTSESPTLFLAKLIRHILHGGNAYLWKAKDGQGRVVALRLLNPEAVKEYYEGAATIYVYNSTRYTDEDILHIPSLITDDRGKGYAPVELARIAVTLGIQLDEYSLSAFGNGLNTKLLLDIAEMTTGMKSDDDAQKLALTVSDYIRRNYSGSENAGKPLVLWKGMKATELTHQSSNAEAQLLDMRKYQEIEVSKIFGVPPFLIGNYEIKYGGLEQAMTVFSNFTLGPYLRHIEQRLGTLLSEYEQGAYYFEFDLNVLLRPDEKSRAEFYAKLFALGAISPAEICAKENLEAPKEGGDARFVMANMMPLRDDVLEAYMAGAKLKAQELTAGKAQPDPSRAAGDQAQ